MSWAKSAFVRSEILTLFFNTLNVDEKYSHRNMLNFRKQLEAQFSQKKKNFSEIFLSFLKYALNLEHFEKKHEYPSLVISRNIDSERGGYLNV